MLNLDTINIVALAYLGDAVYEEYVRHYLVMKGIQKVDDLQKEALQYVSANSQRRIVDNLINDQVFNDLELDVYHRGRNYKRKIHPKNTDIVTYKCSTGFEALIGYLSLSNRDRLDQLMNLILR